MNPEASSPGFVERLRGGLSKTRDVLSRRIESLAAGLGVVDARALEELEETLIGADVGIETSQKIIESLRFQAKEKKLPISELKLQLEKILEGIFPQKDSSINFPENRLTILVMVGVNGVGKTTTIGKICYQLSRQGKKVMLAAGDTFRAGAIDQLQIWADRCGVPLILHQAGSDPGAVVFDAINAAKARNMDVLMIDTAGRLQNKSHLMEELRKVFRIIQREGSEAFCEVLLVLDGTTGQNAFSQVQIFSEMVPLTGLIVTKLDGTARGGVVIGLADRYKIPVKYVGIGEGVEDLKVFEPGPFARAILG